MKSLSERTVPEVVLVALTVGVVAAILFGAATSTTAFGAFNYGWDGTADLRGVADETTDSAVLQNTSAYDQLPGNGTLAVVLGPTEPYAPGELDRIETFLRRGGTLLVGGDFGAGANDLLGGINASARIDGSLLRDERNYGRSPAFPFATNVSVDGVEELALNYPSSVAISADATVSVVGRTSAYAYADDNRNGELDHEESMRSYPILTRESLGNGTVVVLSDPSVFINSMLERGDNRAFARTLFAGTERVRFDYTHAGGIPPLVQLRELLRSSPLSKFLFGTLLVGGVAVAVRYGRELRDRFERRSPTVDDVELSESEIADLVARNHPDWDRERVVRIATQLVERRSGRDDVGEDS